MHNNNTGPGMSDSESHARKLLSLKMKNNKLASPVEVKTHHRVQPGHPQTEETPPGVYVKPKSKQMTEPSIAGALASLHSIRQEEQMDGN